MGCMAFALPCRGRMYAARHVCFTTPFFGCGGVRSMRRGGNHAARRNTAALDVAGAARCLFCIVGRGLDLRPKGRRCAAVGLRNAPAGADPAAHWFGGRERPPYRAAETGNEPGTPARRAPLPGGIYASPTNTRYRVHKPKTLQQGRRLRAQPRSTSRPGTAGEQVRKVFAACRPRLRTGREQQTNR